MIVIYFDGGAKPNPGIGYGSFEIKLKLHESLPTFEHKGTWNSPFTRLTNNQAEYLTLWLALHECMDKFSPADNRVEIFSDSKLLVEQVNDRWRVRDAELKHLYAAIHFVLGAFPDWSLSWNPREVNVEKFGH